jgi:quercetin dioxygenase-like cupin family protein
MGEAIMTDYLLNADINQLIAETPAESIVSRSLMRAAAMNTTLFSFAAGEELSEHAAARPAILHFLTGRARLRLGDDEYEVGAGAWAHMPPHLPHSIRAETEVRLLLYLYGT